MDKKKDDNNINKKLGKKEKKNKSKKTTSKKANKKNKKSEEQVYLKERKESEKNNENNNNNEKKKIVIQKGLNNKDIKTSKKEKSLQENIINSPIIIELKLKIKEKMEKIKELSLSQEENKKLLTDLLKKVSSAIESNADILYLEDQNFEEKEIKIEKLKQILEKRKNENIKIKEENKKYKKKYEDIIKDMNISSVEKFDNLNKRINALRENNSILSKEINIINHKNNVTKIPSLNQKYKITDIKKYSDEYISLTKEKYKQYILLKNNKKLIKDVIQQFQYLIKIIDEKKDTINIIDFEKEIYNLKEDLSGDEENIYNKIISDKTIILKENHKNKNIKQNNSTNNLRILFNSRTKKLYLKNKILLHNKSCSDINTQKIENYKLDNNTNFKKDLNIKDYDFDNMDFNNISNNDFQNMSSKKQKYLNLTEKLDKTINDSSIFYENRAKEISNILDMNSKKLSNIQQENELLKSEIADMKRILEKNSKKIKTVKINNRANFNMKYEDSIKKLNIYKNSNGSETNISSDRESYIESIKKRYIIKNKNKISLIQKESISNNRSYN